MAPLRYELLLPDGVVNVNTLRFASPARWAELQ
jgi:hypothetical protein